jgi:hypothetical protein
MKIFVRFYPTGKSAFGNGVLTNFKEVFVPGAGRAVAAKALGEGVSVEAPDRVDLDNVNADRIFQRTT